MLKLIKVPKGLFIEQNKCLKLKSKISSKQNYLCFSFFEGEKHKYISGIVEENDTVKIKKINQIFNKFEDLAEKLKETHILVGSCNNDNSRYLVPKGHENEMSYTGHPEGTIRISDHWSWYANIVKCPNAEFIQCNLQGAYARSRKEEGKAGDPNMAICIAIYKNGIYYPISKVIR